MASLSAVVADSSPILLASLVPLLENQGIEVLVSTTSQEAAVRSCTDHQPDLLISGLERDRSSDGYAWLRQAHESVPGLRSVILSTQDEKPDITAALEAGASAYVLKTAEPRDISAAVRQAVKRSIYVRGPGGHRKEQEPAAPAPSGQPELTRREREILTLVAEGQTNATVAGTLWVTVQTVKFHLSNIYEKLGVANRTEASRWAHHHGLLRWAEHRSSGEDSPK